MRPEDKRLKEFLERQLKAGAPPEVLDEMYALVRQHALSDAADYLTRLGTEYANKTGDQRLGKAFRSAFYGAAGEIRANGKSGQEEVNQMLAAMKGGKAPEPPPEAMDDPEMAQAAALAAQAEAQEEAAKADIERMRQEDRLNRIAREGLEQ